MASKFGLAGGIPERRVRPIWDAIDSRQFKTALKLSASLLSKYPNSPYALALKALILERMSKADEALSICLNAKELLYENDSVLMDDLTLSTLQIVFQRLDHLDLATSCYEYACGKFPNNLELMMGLFNCFVREYSFVKQQQTAIKMYKFVGEERFLLWAVCSIQLQVLCGSGGEKLLQLAEGLLKKHVGSHSLHEPEALMVYISILEQQARYADALEILSGKLGSLLVIEADKLRIQGRLLAKLGDYVSGANIYEKILEICPDDWESFLHYLGCLMEDDSSWSSEADKDSSHLPNCKVTHLSEEMFDSRISMASAFVQKLQLDTESRSLRCPYLAILEIERRRQLYGKDNHDEMVSALMHYFLKFGHLACFTSDIEMFLQGLNPDKKVKFLDKLIESTSSVTTTPTKVLGQSISVFKIQELIGNLYKLPILELEQSAVKMTEIYCRNLPLSKDLDPQENMHGEELLCMVCNLLVQLFYRTKKLGYFMEAIMVLEFGLTIRRYVWQYKILLVHLYSHLSALTLAHEWYKSLDVKNILMETLMHNILPQMLSSPLWVDLSNLLKDYLRFMDDHFRESADLTFLAYRHRNYSKVIEFVQFKERLQRSNHYLLSKIEKSILELKQKADNIEEQEAALENLKCGIHFVELSNEIGSKSLTVNEDLHSRPWWTPTPEKNYLLGLYQMHPPVNFRSNDESLMREFLGPFEGISYCPKENLKKKWEQNIRGVVERRSLLPRLIYLSIQSASASVKENVEVNGSLSVPKITTELKFLLDRYAKILGSSFGDAVEVVKGISNGGKSAEAFGSDIIEWMNFAVFLNAWNLHSSAPSEPGGNPCCTWETVNTLLEKCILEKTRSMDSLISLPWGMFPLVVQLVTEPLSWHVLVIQSCIRSSLPSGKKKKKGGHSEQSTSLLLNAIRDSVESIYSVLKEVTNWVRKQLNRKEDEHLDVVLSPIRRKEQDEGPGKVIQILENLITSIDEVEIGDRISQALKSWDVVDVGRKILTSNSTVLYEFLRICESKLKALQALRQQMTQV